MCLITSGYRVLVFTFDSLENLSARGNAEEMMDPDCDCHFKQQGAQGWCTGMTLRDGMGRWRGVGSSGWGTHVHPWLIHVNVWQKLLQYCKVISLQFKKKKKKPATIRAPAAGWLSGLGWTVHPTHQLLTTVGFLSSDHFSLDVGATWERGRVERTRAVGEVAKHAFSCLEKTTVISNSKIRKHGFITFKPNGQFNWANT